MTAPLPDPQAADMFGVQGRVRVQVRDRRSRRLVFDEVFSNQVTQYALNTLATWLVGGGGVVAPGPPSYLSLGLGPINLLSANQADFESGTTGWQALSNCTLAQSASQAWHGSYSLAVTGVTSGPTMTAVTPAGTAGMPVTVGRQYLVSGYLRAAATARSSQIGINWYDGSGNLLSAAAGSLVADSRTGWTRLSCLATAPTNAAYAALYVNVASPASSEVHYLDGVLFAYAPDGPMPWQAGYSGSAWAAVTPTVNDTALNFERYATRAQMDTGYAQTALANILHTYQQTDPAGPFVEAGLWDAAVSRATLLGAQANPGDTSLTLTGSPPAIPAGQQIYLPAAPLASPTVSSFTGASTTGGFLTGGTTYYYELTAVGPNGETIPGAENSYTPPSGTSTNQITLNWAAVGGATGYKIYRATSPGQELLLATVGAVTSYVDNTNTVPAGSPPTADASGRGEYALVAAAASAGATSWTLQDQLVYTHPTTYVSGTAVLNSPVVVFDGNLWAHVALTGVSKTGTQLLTLQWEIDVQSA